MLYAGGGGIISLAPLGLLAIGFGWEFGFWVASRAFFGVSL